MRIWLFGGKILMIKAGNTLMHLKGMDKCLNGLDQKVILFRCLCGDTKMSWRETTVGRLPWEGPT